MTTARPPGPRPTSLPDSVDLLAIALFVVWFYFPFFSHGYPSGDFASTIGTGAAGDAVTPTPWSFPRWTPELMCGRPVIGFMSPFRLLAAPFQGLDPVTRMKGLVVLYNVLSGLTMYWLIVWSGAGRLGATFGGMIYPIMAPHISRTAVHGNIHLPMFWAVLPLILLGILRLRSGDRRGIVILGLLFALGFLRDSQRTVITFTALALLLAGLAIYGLARTLRTRGLGDQPYLVLGGSVAVAFALGVSFDAFEIVNGFVGDPFRGNWRENEQQYWIDKWSLDNLFSFVDRATWLGKSLGHFNLGFYESSSRYLGLSLLALCLYGALMPAALGGTHRRFWFVLSLLPTSIWLAFGHKPLWASFAPDMAGLFVSPLVALPLKLGIGAVAISISALLVVSVARNLAHLGMGSDSASRWRTSVAIVGIGVALFVGVAPLPAVSKIFFFLRHFRNPDWFQVTLASFAVAYASALAVGAIVRRFDSRPRLRLAVASAMTVVATLDVWWYRDGLAEQRSFEAVDEFRALHEAVGADADDFRVVSAEFSNANVDVGYAWNHKRLAWDFRSYSAPRTTQAFIDEVHNLLASGGRDHDAAVLAGVANIKYVIDEHGYSTDLGDSASLKQRFVVDRMSAYQNLRWKPWVQAYPGTALLISELDASAIDAVAAFTPAGYAIIHARGAPSAAHVEAADVIYHDPRASRPEWRPAGSNPLQPGLASVPMRSFTTAPEIAWTRPSNEEIRVTITTTEQAVLVVSESYHPWWQLTVNGHDAPLTPVQFAFLGSVVEPGRSEVVLRFRPPARYYACGFVSLGTVAVALGYLWVTRRSPVATGKTLI